MIRKKLITLHHLPKLIHKILSTINQIREALYAVGERHPTYNKQRVKNNKKLQLRSQIIKCKKYIVRIFNKFKSNLLMKLHKIFIKCGYNNWKESAKSHHIEVWYYNKMKITVLISQFMKVVYRNLEVKMIVQY